MSEIGRGNEVSEAQTENEKRNRGVTSARRIVYDYASRIPIERVLKLRQGKSLIVGNPSKQSRLSTRAGSTEV